MVWNVSVFSCRTQSGVLDQTSAQQTDRPVKGDVTQITGVINGPAEKAPSVPLLHVQCSLFNVRLRWKIVQREIQHEGV